MTKPWDARPIYDRLPVVYQTNEVADWLTQQPDSDLISTKTRLDNFYADYLNPDTAHPDNLDWLGQLCGFTGEHWDTTWPTEAKRRLCAASYDFLWPNKGTKAFFEFWIQVLSIPAQIRTLTDFYANFSTAGEGLGTDGLVWWFCLAISVARRSPVWRLAERLRRLYAPIWTVPSESLGVCYDQFYANFSVAGEPVWFFTPPSSPLGQFFADFSAAGDPL
jgi:hypothetical protein